MEIKIGDRVYANDTSEYFRLHGTVTDIKMGEEKDTENEGDDVYVCFDEPSGEFKEETEQRLIGLYGEDRELIEVNLDSVIMDRSMLVLVKSV